MLNTNEATVKRLEIVAESKKEADLFASQEDNQYIFIYSLKIQGEKKKKKYIYSA